MRIITFNLRFDNKEDRENAWPYRRDLSIQVIQRYSPSILGTQEGTLSQLTYIQKKLSGYIQHAPGRVPDDLCQYPTIFYQHKELQALEGGEFWLSRTPIVHRSKDWDSLYPRMMSYGLFLDRATEKQAWIVVTHLDNQGKEARRQQARIIGDWVRRRTGPVIVMGDFNDSPGSSVHQLLLSPEVGLQDTWQVLGRKEDEQSMTHHGFRGTPQKGRIDWILVSDHFRVLDAYIIRDHAEGRYPSDHFPYGVDLEWL